MPSSTRRRRVHVATLVVVAGVAAAIVALAGTGSRPIADAGFDVTDYVLVGGSHVADRGSGQFKESLVRLDGGSFRGNGSVTRVAEQIRGQRIECLDMVYEDSRFWTSSTPATGRVEFRDAATFERVGAIELSVTIIEVVFRPLAVDPLCQSIEGSYIGVDGRFAGVEGTIAAGFAPTRIEQFWTFDDGPTR